MDWLTIDLFSIYLLPQVDIVRICYIKVDFTFGLPDFIEEFVISRSIISRFYSKHFTLALARTKNMVPYIKDLIK